MNRIILFLMVLAGFLAGCGSVPPAPTDWFYRLQPVVVAPGKAPPGAIAVQPRTPLIVVEGNYLLLPDSPWNQVQALLDETWFVDVPQDLRVGRLTQRHQQFGRSAQDAADWVQHTDEPNARRIEAARAKADVMFRWDA